MAEIIEAYEFRGRGSTKYPWESWLDGRIWRVKRGEDFTAGPAAFASAVHGAGKKIGIRVRTSRDGDIVTFQALRDASPKEKRLADLRKRGAA